MKTTDLVPKKLDRSSLKGKIFGTLLVIHQESGGKNSRWVCKCSCGKEKVISRSNLKRGQKSCGCLRDPRKPLEKNRKIDIVGKKIGNLTAISWVGGKYSVWLFECICGNKLNIPKWDFLKGKRKSCGCVHANHKKMNLEDFLKNVEKTDSCWIYKGYINNKTGYGTVGLNKNIILAHRASWIFHHGEIAQGKLVCHTCDNRKCVNPAHLYIGTHKTNALDRVERNFSSFKKRKNHATD